NKAKKGDDSSAAGAEDAEPATAYPDGPQSSGTPSVVPEPEPAYERAAATAVAPPATETAPRRVEVQAPPEEDEWAMARPAATAAPSVAPKPHKPAIAEIESHLQPIGNDDFNALKRDKPAAVKSAAEAPATDYAETFEVPKVVG